MNITDLLASSDSFRKLNPHLFGQRVADPAWECAESERKLHEEILRICNQRRWWARHDRMDLPTTGNLGAPDFIIFRKGGVLCVECKSKTGKLSREQEGVAAWLAMLGHEMHVVRSIKEFEEVAR